MQHDVLHHHDGIVDHQADRRGQSAQRHQVEALAQHPQRDEGDRTVAGITSPATSEVPQSRRNSTMMSDARTRPIRIASRTLVIESPDDLRLIVERLELDAGRQASGGCVDLGVHRVGDRHRIAVRLAVDVQQHGRLAVGRHDRVHRLHGRRDRARHRRCAPARRRRGLDDDLSELRGVVHLPVDQAR